MDLIETNNGGIRHPWELSRFHCLSNEIKTYHKEGSILDIGCGDSFFDRELLKTTININEMYGVDIFLENDFDENNYHVVNSYEKLNGKKFDTIIMFDVLEHIEKDDEFLNNQVEHLLKEDGKVIITVPAFQFLFSEHDKFLKHFRRYDKKMIKKLVEKSNFKIVDFHYFYFSLFMFRLLFRNDSNDLSEWKHDEKSLITKFIISILNIDYLLSKLFGKVLPGLSLFVILKKDFQ